MRKKTINCLFDNILWYTIYLLPLITYIISGFHNTYNDLATFMQNIFTLDENIIFSSLSDLNTMLRFFVDENVITYITYFAIMVLIHVMIDIVLWIPKLAHTLIERSCNKNE